MSWFVGKGKYDGRIVRSPINDNVAYMADYQWTDEENEWYLINGLRCSEREIEPYLVSQDELNITAVY